MRYLAAILALPVLLSLVACSGGGDAAQDFAVGQVWAYRTRPVDEGSRLHIVRIDGDAEPGAIYHIQVDGLSLAHPFAADGVQHVLPHLPVAEATLRASVTKLLSTDAAHMPDISDAYAAWHEGFEAGEAGVFTVPVAEIVQNIEDAVNGRQRFGRISPDTRANLEHVAQLVDLHEAPGLDP